MDIKELAKKLHTLSIEGENGEKELAKKNLEKIIEKYNLSECDIIEETTDFYDFKYHSEYEKRLLQQISYKVTNDKEALYIRKSYKRTLKVVVVKCTKAQFIEIEFLYNFYKELFERDLKIFTRAFIQKHRLFGELKEDETPSEIEHDLFEKMMLMSSGMTEESPLKQLETK